MRIKNYNRKDDWENYYTGERKIHLQLKNGIFTPYDIYLCDHLIQAYIPFNTTNKKKTITEIGSGDGKLLNKFASMLNFQPIGIEYSKEAAKMAERNGIKTIVADVFDENFLKKHNNSFDVVFSYGFIEHILPVEKAIDVHLRLVKPGGYFMIQIPRFKGFNYWKVKFLRPEQIPLHNLDIMESEILNKLLTKKEVKKIYCSNYGTFRLRFPMDKKNFRFYLLKTICLLDYILNPTFRFLFKEKGFETRLFSPAVMYIGQKKITTNLKLT